MKHCARVVVAFVAVAGPWFTAPMIATAAPATTCAASSISVALVVDFDSSVSADCVPADSSDTGLDVLTARHQVTFASSGLVCSIDGVPSSGCGEQTGSHYAYWAYFRAPAGSWVYQSIGPGAVRVKSTTVEGWRFEPDGAGGSSDPAPRGSPDPAATCGPEPPPSTVTTTTADVSSPVVDPAPAASSAPSAAATTDPSSEPTTAGAPSPSTTLTAASERTASPAGTVRITTKAGGSSVWPLVGAGGVIAALAGGGVFITRRRDGLDR